MGRRSINTTKSGKYMNPTDQARKEARKKELKKNKKQRQMVRAAVLKGKDPAQLIEEMEKIDEMEYNVFQPSPLNEKVLREKRKKLKDTLDRVLRLYQQDDPDLWSDLKRKEVDYEKRRNKRVQYYESVRHAQSVQIDEIPLPSSTETPIAIPPPRKQLPLPPPSIMQSFVPPPGILKKNSEPVEDDKHEKEPPGCPIGPPPNLKRMRELDSDYEDESAPVKKKTKGIRFSDESDKKTETGEKVDDEKLKPNYVQQKMLALSGQNIDDFMKEMESVQKKKELERLAEEEKAKTNESDAESAKASEDSDSDDSDDDDDDDDDDLPAGLRLGSKAAPAAQTAIIPNLTSLIALPPIPSSAPPVSLQPPHPIGLPPGMMFRPPPLRPGLSGIRMPPGPPPGRMPRMAIRMPPPPPGMPRHMHHHPKGGHHHGQQPPGGLNVVSAAPQLTSKDPKSATITAKPQIRNLSADVTRFVPSALRTKRDDVKKTKPKPFVQDTKQAEQTKGPTKDDAYMQFMNEMQGLL